MTELNDDNEGFFERNLTLHDGQIVTIVYDEDHISFSFKLNKNITHGSFKFIEISDREEKYLIGYMATPIIKNGIGTEVLKFFKELTGAKIYARPNDGIVREDGTHLTNGADTFVLAMQKLGLIEPYEDELEDDFDSH